jgi:hypothetical protein
MPTLAGFTSLATVGVLAQVVFCGSVLAQSGQPSAAALPSAFLGVGLAAVSSDAESRMRLHSPPASWEWSLEAGVRLQSRVGLGVEFTRAPDVSATTSGETFRSSGLQRERTLLVLCRARLVSSTRWALDGVGGAGILFQHHEVRQAPCYTGCDFTYEDTLDHHAPAFSFGVDVPVRAGRHASVVAVARYYLLRRGENVASLPAVVPWQYEWHTSTRLAAGVSARLVW